MSASKDTSSESAPSRWSPRRRRWASALLFFCLFALYQANPTVLDEGDSVPSINLPIAVLKTGSLAFTPEHFPEMFKWHSKPPFQASDDFFFLSWRQLFGGKPAWDWGRSGHLRFNKPRYYVVKAPKGDGYVSTFGPLPGLTLLPLMSVFYAIDPDLPDLYLLKMSICRLHSALLVASIALLIFWTARRWVSDRNALLLGIVYGVGTCAFAVSSQALWQQTVNQFFLTLGTFAVLSPSDKKRYAILAGFAFGTAMACRPTSVFFLAGAGAYLLARRRAHVLPFVVATLPVPLAIAFYNSHYFGNPLTFAQELVGYAIAEEKTGSRELFQTPLLEGAKGLLFSPSRGMMVFSPVLGLAFWGIVRIWRRPEFEALRPSTLAVLLIMGIQCKWFDWWGGWTYGYRPWLDVQPFLVLFMAPVLPTVLAPWFGRSAFAVAMAWGVFVQGIGAWSYDRSWNNRLLFVARSPRLSTPMAFFKEEEARDFAQKENGQYVGHTFCDVDLPVCRYRLWSWEDNIIFYHYENLELTHSRRLPNGWAELRPGKALAPGPS